MPQKAETNFEKEVYLKYYALVYSSCKRRLFNTEALEDAVQSTFLLYIKEQDLIQSELSSWFYWASINVCEVINNQEKKQSKAQGGLKQINSFETPDKKEKNNIILDKIIQALPKKNREMLLMRYFDQMTFEEIAERCKCKEANARKIVDRTLAFLRSKFKKQDILISSTVALLFSTKEILVAPVISTSKTFIFQNSINQQLIVKGVSKMLWISKLKASLLIIGGVILLVPVLLVAKDQFINWQPLEGNKTAKPSDEKEAKNNLTAKPYFTYEPWVNTGLMGDYFSLTREPDGKIAHWKMLNVVFGGVDRQDDTVYKAVGKNIYSIPNFVRSDLENGLIKSSMFPFYNHCAPRLRPIITRVGCNQTEDGYFITCSIGGEYYAKGGTELIPQMFYSKTGEKGTWENLGIKKMDMGVVPGDLEYFIEKGRKENKQMRFETATVLKINGIFHYYVESSGVLGGKISLLQSKDFKGPWKFYGNSKTPTDITKNLKTDVAWLFFTIIPLKDRGYMLVGGNKWPANEIYAAISKNGLHFEMLSNSPIVTIEEMQKIDPSAKFLKSFRGIYNDDGSFDVGVSVDTNHDQVMFVSRTKFP